MPWDDLVEEHDFIVTLSVRGDSRDEAREALELAIVTWRKVDTGEAGHISDGSIEN